MKNKFRKTGSMALQRRIVSEKRVISVPVGRILPNPAQARRSFSDDGLVRLADSIMRYGVLQPLTVRATESEPVGKKKRKEVPMVYELLAGERRLRAAKMAGLAEVPCITVEADDRKAAELTLIENTSREDLGFFEEAAAMASLIDIYGLTQEETAGVFGTNKSAVSAKLRLLRLTPAEKMLVIGNGLTEMHAKALLKICDSERRLEVLRETVKLSLNVSQTEELVDSVLCPKEEKMQKKRRATIKDTRIVFNTIDKAIESIEKAGVPVEKERKETEDAVELVFRIRKSRPMIPSASPDFSHKTVITNPKAV